MPNLRKILYEIEVPATWELVWQLIKGAFFIILRASLLLWKNNAGFFSLSEEENMANK